MLTGKLQGLHVGKSRNSLVLAHFVLSSSLQEQRGTETRSFSFPQIFFPLQISKSVMDGSRDGEWEKRILKADPLCKAFCFKNCGCVLSLRFNMLLSMGTLWQVWYRLSCSGTSITLLPDKGPKCLTVLAELVIPDGYQDPRKFSLKGKRRKLDFRAVRCNCIRKLCRSFKQEKKSVILGEVKC